MSFWINLGKGLSMIGDAMRGAEQATLMTAARSDPNAIVRQQKIQMVLQLPTVTDQFTRGQIVSEIIRRP